MEVTKWLTIPKMAAETDESNSVYRKRIRWGEIRAHRFGRNIRVHRDDFDAYLRSREVKQKSDKGDGGTNAACIPTAKLDGMGGADSADNENPVEVRR
jgi:excisionase family DNA binding protein